MIEQPNLGRSMAAGAATANAIQRGRRQNQLADLYAQHGPGIMAGDQNALQALAGVDPMQAFSINRTMTADRQADADRSRQYGRENASDRRAEEAASRAAQMFTTQMDQLEREQGAGALAAEVEATDKALAGAVHFYQQGDQQGYTSWLQRNNLDPAQFPFEHLPAIVQGYDTARTTWGDTQPKGADDQRGRKVAEYQRLYGYDEATATALADGIIGVSRDPLTNEVILFDKRTMIGNQGEPGATQTPPQVGASGQGGVPLGGYDLPGVKDSFGTEGAVKGVANAVVDTFGGDVPYQDVQDAQSDLSVLKEDMLSDLANGYPRQPPSWVLRALEDLTPKAGSPFEGPSKAQSKLRALDRKFSREIELNKARLKHRMKPAARAEVEGQITALELAKGRVSGVLGAFSDGVEIRPEVAERLKAYQ